MGYTFSMAAILTTEPFDTWFAGLRDLQAKHRIQARIRRAELGNLGDCEAVGEGVSEMRIHAGAGYRVYFIQRGLEFIVLLDDFSYRRTSCLCLNISQLTLQVLILGEKLCWRTQCPAIYRKFYLPEWLGYTQK